MPFLLEKKNNMESLRLIGALLVMTTHSLLILHGHERDWLYNFSHGAAKFSYLGLWIFFVLSGFLVTHSALNSSSGFNFWKKRILRIYPALFGLLIFTIFIFGPLATTLPLSDYFSTPQTWQNFWTLNVYRIKYFLPGVFVNHPHSSVNGALWALPYELTLYLWPFCLIFFPAKIRRYATLILFSILYLVLIFYSQKFSGANIPVFNMDAGHLLNFALLFLGGSLFYLWKEKIPRSPYLTGGLLLIWIWSFGTVYADHGRYFVIPYLVLYLATFPAWFKKLATYGDFTYGFYLYGFVIQQLLFHFTGQYFSAFSFWFLSIILTLPFAVLSWYAFEKPMLKFK